MVLPILLCSTSGPPLTSKDGAGITFVASSTSLFITDSENHTTARRNKILPESQILSNYQENLKTFNSTLNSSYPDQWPPKVVCVVIMVVLITSPIGHRSKCQKTHKKNLRMNQNMSVH
ncbi:hypothetical protein PoB_006176100 [Plakobranchus ocellatus]|uniref:Uncharacterized protein n=1 Tax=Plakobranchus ocellatus TaxID=259542 RepID=A0AAV4CTR5_9GAST|nr:hypothetical protein PoB_006176100 [Plakobranchus ocellatus]